MTSSSSSRPRKASDVLTRDEIRALTAPSNLRGAMAILRTWAIIALALAALARWPHPVVFAIVVVVLGGRQLALAVMMHEAAHGTLFRARWANETLVDVLCARPVWTDVLRYRKHHLRHHAHTGTERDPDLGLALAGPIGRASLARKIARDLLGVSGVKRVIGLVAMDAELLSYDVGGGAARLPRRALGDHLGALARNAGPTLAANLVLAGALALLGHAWVLAAWVVAFFTTYGLFLRVRSFAEHACTERTDDPLANTRTTRMGWLARLTVAPLNVGYHLEHHLLPTVPYFRLPAMSRLLVAKGALVASAIAPGYLAVLARVGAEPRAAGSLDAEREPREPPP